MNQLVNRSKTKTTVGDQMIKVFSWRGRKGDDSRCCAHVVMRVFPSSNRKHRLLMIAMPLLARFSRLMM